jgi:hypothetical protein
MTLPTEYQARKDLPLYTFLTQYFPDALVELVKISVAGNAQHNPGEPLHWARGKSTDQLNTAMRHIFDHGAGTRYDEDGTMHLAKAAWRLLAEIQGMCEKRDARAKPDSSQAVPSSPGAWGIAQCDNPPAGPKPILKLESEPNVKGIGIS